MGKGRLLKAVMTRVMHLHYIHFDYEATVEEKVEQIQWFDDAKDGLDLNAKKTRYFVIEYFDAEEELED